MRLAPIKFLFSLFSLFLFFLFFLLCLFSLSIQIRDNSTYKNGIGSTGHNAPQKSAVEDKVDFARPSSVNLDIRLHHGGKLCPFFVNRE